MEFRFDQNQENAYEGWLTKANKKIIERWQRRYFRLQKRCIYYFKKEAHGELPCGFIPLIDIEVNEVKRKGKGYIFSIKLTKNPTYAKKSEYLISAESEQQRKQWIDKILENQAISIVGEPYELATQVSPINHHDYNLIPYFIPPIMQLMNTSGYKLRNVWTVELPGEIIHKGEAILDQNYMLPTDDIHNALGILLDYFHKLPESFLPSNDLDKYSSKVTVEDLKTLIRSTPAPVRQLLKELGLCFHKILQYKETNNANIYSLIPIVGNLLIRPPSHSSYSPAQIKSIQENIGQCFLKNTTKLFDDVHQFLGAPRLPVIRKARVIKNINNKGEELLNATKGLLVYVVREDSYKWCTVYTSNRRVGLIHSSYLRDLTPEEEKELNSGQNIDGLMDVVREHRPEMMILFDGMNDEIIILRDVISSH